MLFDSSLFIWFFLIVYVGFWLLHKRSGARTLWLLVASYLFYASWNWKFLGLIVFSTVVDFVLGKTIHQTEDPKTRKRWLWCSVAMNLGLLAYFKYTGFFLEISKDVANALGMQAQLPTLSILLPVGISFYTFQTMSYTIDIYRREIEPVKSFWKFALFVSFFPQLVAGPIVRAKDFLPQLHMRPIFESKSQNYGLYLIAIGLFKKVAIANTLSVNLVDRVFEQPQSYSALEVLLGVYGYAIQIYCDFSGYTDVAIGAALLLGFTLPANFDRPYASLDLQDFWRRWHISLSSWLRDYLYISLGGNRHGSWRTYFNLLMTMVLGGLWHGAGWNFLIWGILHGGVLALNRAFQRRMRHIKFFQDTPLWYDALCWFATFHFVCFAWIFFRSPTFDEAIMVLQSMTELTTDIPNITGWLALTLFGAMAVHLSPRVWEHRVRDWLIKTPVVVQAILLVLLAVLLSRIKGLDVVPFIYFQF